MIRNAKKINGKTPFEQKWGIHVKKLAEQEGVTPEALHMRVRNYGTPFQRAPKPSDMEILYGKTARDLAIELNCTPTGLKNRVKLHGDVYYSSQYQHNQGKVFCNVDWRDDPKFNKPSAWLHENHPWHKMWRITLIRYVLEGMVIQDAVDRMLSEEAPSYARR